MDSGLLMQHISEAHVQPQSKSFVCQWRGCKVFNKPSTNKSWLSRHILHHSGDKPFCCIVNGCHMRFTSQFSLERHVNGHFNADLISQQKSVRNRDDTPTKVLKKRKLRRKRLLRVKRVDYLDTRSMQHIRNEVCELEMENPSSSQDQSASLQPLITFQSRIIARRCGKSGVSEVLLHWEPPDLLPDEWTLEPVQPTLRQCRLPLSLIPSAPTSNLYQALRFRPTSRK
ncbi:hypothetical protein CAPTEDRAFT_181931 [Capitella teleta]|uniref:C2H2-type domain-containing protein n=1 Tax=Capitella teleta TaxID=283909 RepID=R7UVV8_CAPTE|nr:hypothetical protein CAPTEDRAFT_181931 [Capitella teleta]|eukprot:ELU08052.1 hypothetical protein CAPTEDRAFT_181931 [Capitella teleta]